MKMAPSNTLTAGANPNGQSESEFWKLYTKDAAAAAFGDPNFVGPPAPDGPYQLGPGVVQGTNVNYTTGNLDTGINGNGVNTYYTGQSGQLFHVEPLPYRTVTLFPNDPSHWGNYIYHSMTDAPQLNYLDAQRGVFPVWPIVPDQANNYANATFQEANYAEWGSYGGVVGQSILPSSSPAAPSGYQNSWYNTDWYSGAKTTWNKTTKTVIDWFEADE